MFRPFFYVCNNNTNHHANTTTATSSIKISNPQQQGENGALKEQLETIPKGDDHSKGKKCADELFRIESQNYASRLSRNRSYQAKIVEKILKSCDESKPSPLTPAMFAKLFNPQKPCDVICMHIDEFESLEDRQMYREAIDYFDAHPLYWQYFTTLVKGRLFLRSKQHIGYCITLHDCHNFMNNVLACLQHPCILPPNVNAFAHDKKIFMREAQIVTSPQQLLFFKVFFERGIFLDFLNYLHAYANPEALGRTTKQYSKKKKRPFPPLSPSCSSTTKSQDDERMDEDEEENGVDENKDVNET